MNAVCDEQRQTPLHDAVLAYCQAGPSREEMASKIICLLLRYGALTLIRDKVVTLNSLPHSYRSIALLWILPDAMIRPRKHQKRRPFQR